MESPKRPTLQQNSWTNPQQTSGYSVTTSQPSAEWPTPSQCQDRNTSSEPSTTSKHSKSQRSQHTSTGSQDMSMLKETNAQTNWPKKGRNNQNKNAIPEFPSPF